MSINNTIAKELQVSPKQVTAAVDLLDGGATVPFIARYRKEVTGGLDDAQLRELEQRLGYLRELEQRKQTILKSIEEQGKLTDALRLQIEQAQAKQDVEDLYLPYKPKRRTKGQIAIEAGLQPLADALFADPTLNPEQEAQRYFVQPDPSEPKSPDFSMEKLVLDGVRDIWSEAWAQEPKLVQDLREWMWETAHLQSSKRDSAPDNNDSKKFQDYFDYSEPVDQVPSHRALAVLRGRAQDVLDARIALPELDGQSGAVASPAVGRIARHIGWSDAGRAADALIAKAVQWCWKVKLSLSIERDLTNRLREQAEAVAIDVFAENLRDLLLAAPAGSKSVMGLDPGIRTGVKVAVVDATGKLLDTATVYPHQPRNDWDGALHTLNQLCQKHHVELIAIGNGTASRETDKLAADLIKQLKTTLPTMQKLVISEAGASVYSASAYASAELPELDVSLRGAVSIARRLQDPLAELVKIDPKSIGVGQYQHDVNQVQLSRSLDAVVEDCVNGVGVNLNTASPALLSRVSGLSQRIADAVVTWREQNGAFTNRKQLNKVSGLGAKTFEQSAGFLRITDGDNPLDATSVHPESYFVVERILQACGAGVKDVMGQSGTLKALKPQQFADEQAGVATVQDILTELEKPGRDPRPDFVVARFNDGVEDIADLREGMILEGTVSNVAAFGAFVDIGVHQDGLVHISQLADRFVKDPHDVVSTGQVVKVTVMEVDIPRKRIGLSMRSDAKAGGAKAGSRSDRGGRNSDRNSGGYRKDNRSRSQSNNAGGGLSQSLSADSLAKLQSLKRK